uniref:EB domain-containing protein n=1 Tax=Heligmosomoides polygyrus TaxID=6339 RepID=A0A8L8L0Q2_HELPZ
LSPKCSKKTAQKITNLSGENKCANGYFFTFHFNDLKIDKIHGEERNTCPGLPLLSCGSRCVAAANCPLGGLPGQRCVIKIEPSLAFNFPSDQDDCPPGQSCVAAADSPVGHCCPVVCPLASHVDTMFSCDPNATQPLRCPSDTHFCHLLSDGLVSQAVCCRRPCNALAPNALYANNQCIPRGQLNSACTTNAQCGGGEGMECVKGQCQCVVGFHPSVDSLTHPMKNPSQSCSRDCENEALSKDTSCMKVVPGVLGSLCFVQRQCPVNSGCYRGRCMCRCGFEQKGDKCVALPPPPTTTSQPSIGIIPGVSVPRGNDLFKLFGQIFGGGGGANNAIGSFING